MEKQQPHQWYHCVFLESLVNELMEEPTIQVGANLKQIDGKLSYKFK